MPTISLIIPDNAAVLANLRRVFPNTSLDASGSTVPTNPELAANVKVYLVNCLQQKYRGYLQDVASSAAAKAVQDLSVT